MMDWARFSLFYTVTVATSQSLFPSILPTDVNPRLCRVVDSKIPVTLHYRPTRWCCSPTPAGPQGPPALQGCFNTEEKSLCIEQMWW